MTPPQTSEMNGGNMDDGEMNLDDVAKLAAAVLDEVEVAVVGKRAALGTVLSGILAGGHVLSLIHI